MSTTKLAGVFYLLAIFAIGGMTPTAMAQREAREAAHYEVRGILKSIDTTAGTITIAIHEGRQPSADKSFALAKNAEVAVHDGTGRRGLYKEAKLADIPIGSAVGLILTADQKAVDAIVAEGPMIHGVLKSVDVTKNSLTIHHTGRGEEPQEKTYTLAAHTEIGIDDGRGRRFSVWEGKLGDLSSGAMMTLWLSVDQKEVHGVLAEGPNIYGTVKSVDAAKNKLTVITHSGREEAEEKTLEVAKDAVTLLDDAKGRRLSVKEGKLADVPVGATVHLKLSVNQQGVTMLRAEGGHLMGMLKAVDADKGVVTILTGGRGENPVEKALTLAKDARVIIDGNPAKLADLKVTDNGPIVQVRLSLDQNLVQSIVVASSR